MLQIAMDGKYRHFHFTVSICLAFTTLFFHNKKSSSRYLNESVEVASMTFSGISFHLFTTRNGQKLDLVSVRENSLLGLTLCSLSCGFVLLVKIACRFGQLYLLFKILNVSIRSPLSPDFFALVTAVCLVFSHMTVLSFLLMILLLDAAPFQSSLCPFSNTATKIGNQIPMSSENTFCKFYQTVKEIKSGRLFHPIQKRVRFPDYLIYVHLPFQIPRDSYSQINLQGNRLNRHSNQKVLVLRITIRKMQDGTFLYVES